jgi:hypothetical protein
VWRFRRRPSDYGGQDAHNPTLSPLLSSLSLRPALGSQEPSALPALRFPPTALRCARAQAISNRGRVVTVLTVRVAMRPHSPLSRGRKCGRATVSGARRRQPVEAPTRREAGTGICAPRKSTALGPPRFPLTPYRFAPTAYRSALLALRLPLAASSPAEETTAEDWMAGAQTRTAHNTPLPSRLWHRQTDQSRPRCGRSA